MGTRYSHLSLEERCQIAGLLCTGHSYRQIAAALDRAPQTISREIRRNGGRHYRPDQAGDRAWARRWTGSRLVRQPTLRKAVLDRLAMGWSPEQVAGRLTRDEPSMRISHETIYRFIDAQIRRTKDYGWRLYLPQARAKRGRRPARLAMNRIAGRISIRSRPRSVDDRLEPGHWEADLVHPTKSGAAILVMQERTSRFTFMSKQPGKHASLVARQMRQWLSGLGPRLAHSVTQDNGTEFHHHQQLHEIGVETYFCDPHSPWQKGGIENFNGRLRRYIPRGTNPDSFSNADIIALNDRLNNTPRKILGFRTPAEVFDQLVHFNCESTCPPARE